MDSLPWGATHLSLRPVPQGTLRPLPLLAAGRKMRVYQREEVPGSPEAHAVFLEAGQPLQEQALARSPQESRPLELAGAARVGLEGPEQRRRFSASELVTRLHSSLRLGRNLAGRAQLGLVAGTGAAQEGSTPELDHPAGVGGGP